MIISLKDTVKLIGISIVACCAVFVCTLFLNYNIDLANIENEITSPAGLAMYNAQVSMGKVTVAVTGGCLVVTSVIMILYYVKNYIDTHGRQLGILKALGYSNIKIAKHFWVFGLSVFLGCCLGFIFAFLYLPNFYKVQNAENLLPNLSVRFHIELPAFLIVIPTIVFSSITVLYAYFRLNCPVLDLIREKLEYKTKTNKKNTNSCGFLKDLSKSTLTSKKSLVFFVGFSAFCFSAMVQMSISMKDLSSESFSWMILLIGLILAFMTLFLSLSAVVKGNTKTIAMMRVFGYEYSTCSKAVLGAYRPISYIGFLIGTVYQYGLLKIVMTFVFNEIENMPTYHFDFKALIITLIAFIIVYEFIMYLYSIKIKKTSIKCIMQE